MIQIIGPQLSQWDTGRRIGVSGSTATHAHFSNRGDSHAVIMGIVSGEAKIPDYLLQTGKDLNVYLVLEGVTQEIKTFSVRKREKPENYVYEDDQRNYIYQLITESQAATEAAKKATEELLSKDIVLSVNGQKPDENGDVTAVGQTTANGGEIFGDYESNQATAKYACAEGSGTKATNWRAHAEGNKTTASGKSSHSEGELTTSSGDKSHAEGENTVSSGENSHAEGANTISAGHTSHTEGRGTKANQGANYSHAEGLGTIAAANAQHVQGTYNIEDTEKEYAHIVGNGSSSKRSNAHTLDWDGNAWYSGDVQAGEVSLQKLNAQAVKTVNGTVPDENGNAQLEVGFFDVVVDLSDSSAPRLIQPSSNDEVRAAITACKNIRYKIVNDTFNDYKLYTIGYGYSVFVCDPDELGYHYYDIGGYKLAMFPALDEAIYERFYGDGSSDEGGITAYLSEGVLHISGISRQAFLDQYSQGDILDLAEPFGGGGYLYVSYIEEEAGKFLITLAEPDLGPEYSDMEGTLVFDD